VAHRVNLIDGNSCGRAAHQSTILTSNGMQTQAVFGLIQTVRRLLVDNPGYTPIVLWDGHARWRRDLYPAYKANRDGDAEKRKSRAAYEAQQPCMTRALETLGVRQMTARTHEADDLAGLLTPRFADAPGGGVLLTTGDRDWIQLVRANVAWQDHRDITRRVTLANLMEKTGYATPRAFLEGKCLRGDVSDAIPGVGGIGEKGAPELLAEFGSVAEFWRRCDSGKFTPRKRGHRQLASPEGRVIFHRNLQLMQLFDIERVKAADITLVKGRLDIDRFGDLCAELGFVSILREINVFCRPFEGVLHG
jgi:5'-3' exonuclease